MFEKIKVGKNNQPAAQFEFEESETKKTWNSRHEKTSREVLVGFVKDPEARAIFEEKVKEGKLQTELGAEYGLSASQIQRLERELGLTEDRQKASNVGRNTWKEAFEKRLSELETRVEHDDERIHTLADDIREIHTKYRL